MKALQIFTFICMWLVGGQALAALPIQHWVMPNGARVYLVESPAVPMLDVQVDLDAGGRRDPAAQAGLASIMASQLKLGVRAQGGQPALDENALGEAWADLGASFGAGAGSDRMSFTLRTLTEPDLLQRAVALAARLMGEPAFDPQVWTRERERISAAIREANTRPATQANRAFEKAVYAEHPYGFDTTEATLQRIAVEDLHNFHAQMVRACRARVTLVGAVSRAQAEQLVQGLLARVPQEGCSPLPEIAQVQPLQGPSVQRIAFDSAQAHVLIGQPGFVRQDPDYFALIVGNYILGGGGFVSRLTHEVREKRGLSYSVYSGFSPGLHAGAFTLGLQTRPDQAELAIKVSQDVLRQFVKEGPTEVELQAAKSNLVGGFALRLDTNRKLLDNVASLAWNDLPLNYLDTWTQQVQRVTRADIRKAFQRVLQPERMVTVVVGGKP
ncbi:MAG: insulinase family protein [Betaproteobacteria bacterium]|nr:insulinase family protein [Betaproteobacteria bacterium]NBY72742.1 insulinase family protein [Betaproteobacteria bacterium]